MAASLQEYGKKQGHSETQPRKTGQRDKPSSLARTSTGLPDLENKNARCSVKSELQINSAFFSVSVSHAIFGTYTK